MSAGEEAGRARVPDMAALAPGQAIHEYRIERVLGGGGFGITYLAQDVNLQLPVAIKEYFPANVAVRGSDNAVSVRSSEGTERFDWGLERFIDEARALASFRHPNIVRVLRYFKGNGTAYIVMDYESGDPLKHWVSRQPGLDQAALLRLVFPLLDGLEAVHRLNFLHRDIKPDNIYIRADGSPVLLDFGAARRVSQEHDMTNIVSPGFAPFEQYHSKGNQGPWTDLYSLGAVLYWLATGRKPLEAASRVREDGMPKAVDVASRAAFGEGLLRAIDWALEPHEQNRPQNVAALREALRTAERERGSEPTALATQVQTQLQTQVMDLPRSSARGDDTTRKNVLGTIMFLDLVGYSKRSVDQQVAIKTQFNELVSRAIDGVDASSRIMLDTGDGAAICFLGDPEEALVSARLLRDLLRHKYHEKLSLRVGLHLGPVRMLKDINDRVNVVGDGINVAQRIMDFSTANQIMVSRAYFDVISRISDGADGLFEFLGERYDKHQRAHEIYRLLDQPGARAPVDDAATTLLAADLPSIPADEVQGIEAELTRAIGPLAQVLMKKTLGRASDAQGLRELLAVSIQDAAAREAFIQGRHSASVRSQPLSQPMTQPLTTQPPSGVVSGARGSRTIPISGRGPASGVPNFEPAQLEALERALSQHIGPLARTLVRREAAKHQGWNGLVQALALEIDKAEDRQRFLATVGKLSH
ncbi:MAG: protein kinase [Hylemonella sp.]|uniref:protein kinase domain-containing protein n=1 Tax=Hylemonella sp. TaxID=2066020 RepID=UPI0022C9138C|nr:protein kinase [Hylemonella sp.]MCZ8252158.1 protein kinase [Hylemonella sp.]